MDAQLRNRYMRAMGIPVWKPKELPPQGGKGQDVLPSARMASSLPAPPVGEGLGKEGDLPADCSQMDWEELRSAVLSCTRCAISKTRTQAVFGVGNRQAEWMIIGEAPGAEEDRQGEPFVGKAGQLLNNMLAAIGMPRESVYIANVLKCRPPNNRDPQPDEAENCRAYLERQIELINPVLILVVGRIAAQNLLQTKAPLAQLRRHEHRSPVHRVPVVVTYHPAYLLRQPVDKRKAWRDLQFAREIFAHHAGHTP